MARHGWSRSPARTPGRSGCVDRGSPDGGPPCCAAGGPRRRQRPSGGIQCEVRAACAAVGRSTAGRRPGPGHRGHRHLDVACRRRRQARRLGVDSGQPALGAAAAATADPVGAVRRCPDREAGRDTRRQRAGDLRPPGQPGAAQHGDLGAPCQGRQSRRPDPAPVVRAAGRQSGRDARRGRPVRRRP